MRNRNVTVQVIRFVSRLYVTLRYVNPSMQFVQYEPPFDPPHGAFVADRTNIKRVGGSDGSSEEYCRRVGC